MNNRKANLRNTLAALVLVGLLGVTHFAGVIPNPLGSRIDFDTLLQPEPSHDTDDDPQKKPARKARAWKLYKLWMAHDERDVASEIVPFLQDEHRPLRESAARMLGHLESPAAEPHLQATLTAVQQRKAQKNYVQPDVLKLALGRIRSRGLRGQAKIAAVVKDMGLSLKDVPQLSQKVKAAHSKANGSAGEKVMQEVVGVLYAMGKRGENIKPFVDDLTLYPPQRVLLQGATLPPDEEAKLIVDHLTKLNAVTPYDGELAEFYLVNLAPQATEALVQRLNEMKQGRVHNGQRGYVELFRSAALTNDARVVPLLKHFAGRPEQPLSGYARMSLEHFEFMGQWDSPRCPWPPLP